MSAVVISDLPALSSVSDSDLMLVRSGGGDYQATVDKVRQINIPGLPNLPLVVQPLDSFMISQSGNSYQIPFNQVGFVQGTRMWFYCNNSNTPSGWTIDPSMSDCLLAVAGSSVFTTGGQTSGTWQQPDHTLTADEMQHYHYPFTDQNETNIRAGTGNSSIQAYKPPSSSVQLRTANVTSQATQPHNHGSDYRPYSAVGYICIKDQ